MSEFKAKMHQIRFWMGLRPIPRLVAYSAPTGCKKPISKGRGMGENGRREGRGGEGKRKKGRGGECCGVQKILKIDPEMLSFLVSITSLILK